MDSVVQLLKMIGCVVQDVLPETGVQTTSNLGQGVVHGVVVDVRRHLVVAEQAVVTVVTEDGVKMVVVVSYLLAMI